MEQNQKYFENPLGSASLLRARGFEMKDGSWTGHRSGGIQNPKVVTLPAGAVLVRFQDPGAGLGQWWSTLHELDTVMSYFGRSGPAADTGRSSGKGILHASNVVRADWGSDLRTFIACQLTCSLKAYYGEGDHAPDGAQQNVQKAVRIIDGSGRHRFVRQVFIPNAWEYAPAIKKTSWGNGISSLQNFLSRNAIVPFSFER